jgi:hypothetical protein
VRELDLSQDLLPAHHEVLRCFGLLSRAIGTDGWCIVGGLMVLAAARGAGRGDSRGEETKDGDVLVDVVTEPGILATATTQLLNLGYRLPVDDFGEDFARCTFVSGNAQIDVLAPDDATESSLAVGELRTIAIPGGRRALEGAPLTRIYYHEDTFDVEARVPDLTTAICVKAAAALDPRTSEHPRHAQDAAFLLACVDDPINFADTLSDDDRDLLVRYRQAPALTSGGAGWFRLDEGDRRRTSAVLEFVDA